MLTLGMAAKECGMTKTAISNAIKAGRLSASRDDVGRYSIAPSELFRVYPIKTPKIDDTRLVEQLEVDYLKRENTLLREQLQREIQQNEKLMLALTYQPEKGSNKLLDRLFRKR